MNRKIVREAEKSQDAAKALSLEGDYMGALALYTNAALLYDRVWDVVNQSHIYWEMGNTALDMHDYARARAYFEEGQGVFDTTPIPFLNHHNLLTGLKIISVKEQNFEQALIELKQLLSLFRDPASNDWSEVGILLELGEIEHHLGHIAASDTYFAQSFALESSGEHASKTL